MFPSAGSRNSADTDPGIPSPAAAPAGIAEAHNTKPTLLPATQASPAALQSGFSMIPVAAAAPVAEGSPGEALVGYLRVDLPHLEQIIRGIEPGVPADVQIAFPMRDGRSGVAAFRRLRHLSADGDSWQLQGTVQGAEHSSAVLTKWKGAIFGSIIGSEDGALEWRQQKDGRIAVNRFDAEHLPDCDTDGLADHKPAEHEDSGQPLLATPAPEQATAAAATKNVIDVVVGYNHQARISLGGSSTVPTDVAAIEAKILSAAGGKVNPDLLKPPRGCLSHTRGKYGPAADWKCAVSSTKPTVQTE